MEITIDTSDGDDFDKDINKAISEWSKIKKQALGQVAGIARDLAKANAPISPTKSQYVASLKGGVTKRKAESFTSGTLTNSIQYKHAGEDKAVVFSATNARSGEYAPKMEYDKYNLGVGSKAKRDNRRSKVGKAFVGRLFLWRGIKGTERGALKILDAAVQRFKRKLES